MGHLNQNDRFDEHHHHDCTVVELGSVDTLSDSERGDAEIDRIIAETNASCFSINRSLFCPFIITTVMMESKLKGCDVTPSSVLEKSGESGELLELEDNDHETLIMRLNLLESLQNKHTVDKEKEDGEVSDEDVYFGQDTSIKITSEPSSYRQGRSSKYGPRKVERSAKRDAVRREKNRSFGSRTTSKVNDSTRHYSSKRSHHYDIDNERSFRSRRSDSRNYERRDRTSSPSVYSSTRRSGCSHRDFVKGKNDTPTSKQVISDLSVTLPVTPNGPNSADVIVSTASQGGESPTVDRVVEASTSHGSGENRSIKRTGDSGSQISVTVNTMSEEHEDIISANKSISEAGCSNGSGVPSHNSSSAFCSEPLWKNRINLTSEFATVNSNIPLPQTPATQFCEKEYALLPPPPAPPVLPKAADVMDKCVPSSIRVQVREGGGRVAQLSATNYMKDHFSEVKRQDLKTANNHLLVQPPPPPPPAENPDNYDNVGMDVESSHSSCCSVVDNEDGDAMARQRMFSESDETQLREMLLNQVILNRMRKTDSVRQSSNTSVNGTNANYKSVPPNDSSSHNESVTVDLRDANHLDSRQQNMKSREARNTPVSMKRHHIDCCDSAEPLNKMRKVDSSFDREDASFLDSPRSCSLSEMELLLREKQSQLNELDIEISERMRCLDSSLRRRTELKSALAEVEADIESGRTQCRTLMQRRNIMRRIVERYEERRLDRLISSEWDFGDGAMKDQASGDRTGTQSNGSMSRSPSIGHLLGAECSIDENHSMSEWTDEQTMRLKLLAKMRTVDPTTSSSQDANNRQSCYVGEQHDECTQTTEATDGVDMVSDFEPLYRSVSFPQRLRRFFGLPSDMSTITTTCTNELSGKKCADVYCESKHTKDEELTTVDVLSMMITHVPGLVDFAESTDIMRQAAELKKRRLPNERFGVFARRLLDELPMNRRAIGIKQNRQEIVMVCM
ncbi:hypothetical protein DICVIV_06013 [Dictyocaulus viviparus]|uniref:Uncharacterized protein n=1 Tax=Dictyocaulus viviparus TaxID=29172 RepID=A0A0D8XTP2_DICVI|nr:hypothetical protein DICVIV_06013 [Dictyocaulus viviparus]